MQYIPGSSVTLSASLHYLAKNFPLPDDSDVQTRIPQICVDYLSHEWLEEDVWKSWRNMTRHKNEVANGVRLENASWRTWWKQRNKLKTVSPETLNWLKDSDVTWLYGPLHTAAEPVPKPKQSTYVDRYNLEKASGKKPILKHRTISELLNIPANDHTAPVVQHSLGSPSLEAVSMDFGLGEDAVRTGSPQPSLPHARSDSAIARRAISLPVATVGSPVSTDSPLQPRPTDSDSTPPRSGSPATQSDGTGLSHDFGSQIHLSPKGTKRHISFNTFVEQCISIDDPATVRRPSPLDESLSSSDDEDASSTSSVIEMRPTSQVVGSRPNERGPILRSNSLSQEREHITIAPIPPTLLKAAEELPAPSPQVVYQPPQGFDWDLSPGNELDDSETSSSSGDNLSTTSGSLDLGFTVPQWGRSPVSVPPPTVGTGATGTVGPAALAENDVYSTAGYQEQQRKYHQVLAEEAQKSGTVIGMHAGRSKWVSGDVANDEEDEADEETDSETDDDAADSSDASMEDGEGESVKLVAATVISTSTGSSTSTASSVATVVGDPPTSPPTSTTARPPNSRKVSQPGKGILKNSGGSGGAAVTVGGGTMADGASGVQ
ncbi:hypothetical protein FRB95_009994 [Tulasnella sp. JGI-2019a]|nr:hypothetical protein FRB95_009994 [Tulasnella sp. JGI-2019a]